MAWAAAPSERRQRRQQRRPVGLGRPAEPLDDEAVRADSPHRRSHVAVAAYSSSAARPGKAANPAWVRVPQAVGKWVESCSSTAHVSAVIRRRHRRSAAVPMRERRHLLRPMGERRHLLRRHLLRRHLLRPSGRWRKLCESANFLLRYTKKETNGEMKEGQEEARELSASNYGRDEWWVLLDPIEGGPSS